MNKRINYLSALKNDLPSGLVVFLIAVPLCLGIALASGAPLFSGIISGIVGGIVIGALSKSHVSVSGPAAGLTAIVLTAITELKTFEIFLVAVVIAGLIQLILGFLRAGSISNYFPTNVIEGMLAAIGIIIILKQIPHAFGYDRDPEGDMTFSEASGQNTFSSLFDAFNYIHYGALLITLISVAILLTWERVKFLKRIKVIPGALVAVIVSVLLNQLFMAMNSPLAIRPEHLVTLPVPQSLADLTAQMYFPDFTSITNPQVWIVAVTIAIVASIETLLNIEAADKLDPMRRYTSTNHELKAQGVGNMLAGLIGGMPMTSVVVRSTANINSGARTKMSAIFHGILLLVCAVFIPNILNLIPLATLAAILIITGYKLCKPAVFKHMWQNGKYQFVPFIVTVLAVVFMDLLRGVALGLFVSTLAILRGSLKSAYFFRKKEYQDGDTIHLRLAEEVSFLNKAAIKLTLEHLPERSHVIIDASHSVYIDFDVLQVISEFIDIKAPERSIKVDVFGFKDVYKIRNTIEGNYVFIEHKGDAPGEKPHTELLNQLSTK